MKLFRFLIIPVMMLMFFFTSNLVKAEGGAPVITGDVVYVTSVANPSSVDTIKGMLTATDEYDGDISSSIYVIEDNYSLNNTVLGLYNITFGVKDSSNNLATITVTVNVIDNVKPMFSVVQQENYNSDRITVYKGMFGSPEFQCSNSTIQYMNGYPLCGSTNVGAKASYNMSFEEVDTYIRQFLLPTDNYDSSENITLSIILNTYSPTEKVYNYRYLLTDLSGNKMTYMIQVSLEDDVAPILSGINYYTKGWKESLLNLEVIKNQLLYTDNFSISSYDPNPTWGIITVSEDNYSANNNIVGSHEIIFEAHDYDGNYAYYTVTINVLDIDVPAFSFGEYIINVSEYVTLTHEDLVALLEAMGVVNTQQLTFSSDTYTENADTVGRYSIVLLSGTEQLNLTINVIADEEPVDQEPIEEEIEEKGFFDKISDFIGSIWSSFINLVNGFVQLFINIWNGIVKVYNSVTGFFNWLFE